MRTHFTADDIAFIKKNYPEKGSVFCGEQLNKTSRMIISWCAKHNIRISEQRRIFKSIENIKKAQEKSRNKSYEKFNVNPSHFLNITTKEVAYILGLLWADGYIHTRGMGKDNSIRLSMQSEDLDSLLWVFDAIGKWGQYRYTQKNRKPQTHLMTQNRVIVEFLIKCGYGNKSGGSPQLILNKIPDELLLYWFRGFIDGDGCFYINKKNYNKQFSVSSTYDQDWTFFKNLCSRLNIKTYSIKQSKRLVLNKEQKYSHLRITNKNDIIKLGNFIYNGFQVDRMGLLRKFNKYQEIKKTMTYQVRGGPASLLPSPS